MNILRYRGSTSRLVRDEVNRKRAIPAATERSAYATRADREKMGVQFIGRASIKSFCCMGDDGIDLEPSLRSPG
jgi:hypothetical protein